MSLNRRCFLTGATAASVAGPAAVRAAAALITELTSFCALSTNSYFSSGIIISESEIDAADFVAYLKPKSFISSRNSAVLTLFVCVYTFSPCLEPFVRQDLIGRW